MASVCIFPRASNTGGVSSFQANLVKALCDRGVKISYQIDKAPFDALLLASTTRNLPGLLRLRKRGVRIVQRLDGINWLQRQLRTGTRHFLRAEYGNYLLALLRSYFATHIVYQSEFVRKWWASRFGSVRVPEVVIHNGVDLQDFSPDGPDERPLNTNRLLLVEGNMQGGYEFGLKIGLGLAEHMSADFSVEMMVVGAVSDPIKRAIIEKSRLPILWTGLVPREAIPALDRSAHLLFSADINPACPNSVIEALACGLPVTGFNTGALPELVTGDAGRLVSYGGDPWKLEQPDLPALARVAAEILQDNSHFRLAARKKAEAAFSLEIMVERYLDVLLG